MDQSSKQKDIEYVITIPSAFYPLHSNSARGKPRVNSFMVSVLTQLTSHLPCDVKAVLRSLRWKIYIERILHSQSKCRHVRTLKPHSGHVFWLTCMKIYYGKIMDMRAAWEHGQVTAMIRGK